MLFIATPAWSPAPTPGPRASTEGHEVNALKPNTHLDPDDFGPVLGEPATRLLALSWVLRDSSPEPRPAALKLLPRRSQLK